jgi:hypothetical protein
MNPPEILSAIEPGALDAAIGAVKTYYSGVELFACLSGRGGNQTRQRCRGSQCEERLPHDCGIYRATFTGALTKSDGVGES